MPNPNKYKDKDKFISDCMRTVHQEGKKTQEQAAGQCYGMWRHKKRKKRKEGCFDVVRKLANKMKDNGN